HPRWVGQLLALYPQVANIAFPVACLTSPGKGTWKGRIGPAGGNPGGVVQHTDGTQRLDQRELVELHAAELVVAVHDLAPLALLLGLRAGQEHPQILDARAGHAVVQVDEQRAGSLPEDVAEVAVPVQADSGQGRGRL